MSLTRSDVLAIVGRLDDARIAEIIASGATAAELTEAFAIVDAGEAGVPRQPSGRVARLCEILSADMPEPGEDR